MTRALFLGLILGFLTVPALADPGREPAEERSEVAEAAQDDADDKPAVDFHFRLRGRFIDELSDLGDVTIQRLSAWSDTRIGDRVQIRATYDVGDTRIHDLWVQYDLGGGIRLRAGRSAPLWLAEFTDAPFGFQMIGAAHGAALTWTRETGVFLFVDRGGLQRTGARRERVGLEGGRKRLQGRAGQRRPQLRGRRRNLEAGRGPL